MVFNESSMVQQAQCALPLDMCNLTMPMQGHRDNRWQLIFALTVAVHAEFC